MERSHSVATVARRNAKDCEDSRSVASSLRKRSAADPGDVPLGPLSKAEAECLAALRRGGSAVLATRHGAVVGLCQGEWMSASPSTFLRLLGRGLVEFVAPTRIAPVPGVAVDPVRPQRLLAHAEAELEPA